MPTRPIEVIRFRPPGTMIAPFRYIAVKGEKFMRTYGLALVVMWGLTSWGFAQPTQSNATGPATTGEPTATQVNPGSGTTGAALIPANGPASRTPDPGTRVGAGNTAPGLYPTKLASTGDVLSTVTAANPQGQTVIQNPGVRSGTLPRVKPDNTISQTNLGANNTGKLNDETQVESSPNRVGVSQPGSAGGRAAGSSTGSR